MFNEKEMIKKKTQIFFEKKVSVHVKGVKEGVWWNGFIEEISSEFLILNERLLGRVIIFFMEIRDIEFYNEVRR